MPSGWNAGDHSVKVFIEQPLWMLRCKCGWKHPLQDDERQDSVWRKIAAAHAEQV